VPQLVVQLLQLVVQLVRLVPLVLARLVPQLVV